MSNKYYTYALYDSREPNHYRYIGATDQQIDERFAQHINEVKRDIKREKKVNPYKCNWANKVIREGGKVCVRKIHEVDTEKQVSKLETELIIKFKEFGHKLTNTSLAGYNSGCNDIRKWKAVDCYDLNGNFLGEFVSIAKAAKALKLKKCGIINQLKGRSTAYRGYIFTYKGDNEEINKRLQILNRHKLITKNIKYPKVGKNVVYVYDSNGNYIRFYRSAALAARSLNVLSGSISYAMKNNKILNDKYYFSINKEYNPRDDKMIRCEVILRCVLNSRVQVFNSLGQLSRYMILNKISQSTNSELLRKRIGERLNASHQHMIKYKSYLIYKKTTRGE